MLFRVQQPQFQHDHFTHRGCGIITFMKAVTFSFKRMILSFARVVLYRPTCVRTITEPFATLEPL